MRLNLPLDREYKHVPNREREKQMAYIIDPVDGYDCKTLTGRNPWKLIDKTDGYIRKLIRSKIVGDAVPAYIKDMADPSITSKEDLVTTLFYCHVYEEVHDQLDERELDAIGWPESKYR